MRGGGRGRGCNSQDLKQGSVICRTYGGGVISTSKGGIVSNLFLTGSGGGKISPNE